MITIHQIPQNSPEWDRLREGLYTGTNAHKLFKFGSIDYAKNDESSSWGGNYYTKRGHILENEAIELYEQIKGVTVDRPGFITNDKYPECGYSPDGVAPNRLIEVKCFNSKKHYEVAKYTPMEILAQIQFGEILSEIRLCDLLLYNPDVNAKDALIIVPIRLNRDIERNFKRIMRGKHVKTTSK